MLSDSLERISIMSVEYNAFIALVVCAGLVCAVCVFGIGSSRLRNTIVEMVTGLVHRVVFVFSAQ